MHLSRIAEIAAAFHTAINKKQSISVAQSSGSEAALNLQTNLRSARVMYYEDCELQAFNKQQGIKAAGLSESNSPGSLTLVLKSGLERSNAYK